MGDDRYGRTPRPGGRAPWERYPADTDDTARTGRRSRRAEDSETAAAPISVQDLVERVDSERQTRRRVEADTSDEPVAPLSSTAQNGHKTEGPVGVVPPSAPGPQPKAANGSQRATRDTSHLRRVANAPGTGSNRAVPRPADPVCDPVTEELTPITEAAPAPPPAERARALLSRKVKSPAGYPTTALPAAVGTEPAKRISPARRERNRRVRLAGRATLAVIAVIALIVTGGGWSYLRAKDNNFQRVVAIEDNNDDVVDADGQTGDENFLIVGTDTRAGTNSQLGAGSVDDAEGARSDTVMLVNIPANRSRVVAVSFPRDLDVTRPDCEGWDNDKATYSGQKFLGAAGDKLNATYALGGPKCLTKVITKLSGLKINHFVGIDFAGFESMVDVVGGVEVCTTKPLVDEVLGTVLTTPGKQVVNGSTALDYVRARHVYGEERSDYDRINRQQRFLSSLLRSALSSKVLFDPGKLNGFINAFAQHSFMDNVTTKDLLTLGRSLQKMQAGNITFLTVPTAGTTSYGNEIPRESDIKAIFRAVIDDQPLPGEKKTDAPTGTSTAPAAKPKLAAVDPSIVSLQVSNGSGQAGVAGTTATKLANQGFQIYSTGNYADGTSAKTKVRYSGGHEAEAATVASSVPGAILEPASGLGSIVELVVGADFAGTVKAPTAFGQTLPDTPSDAGSPSAPPVTLPSDLEHVNAADDLCK
ncbi:LCP family protein [Nocardia seriolae]|uniref:LCP family protein n=1 Tax=Nocardia seriolae TaxID=37332 RepID=UPI000519FBA2|nr:LCP family protein [Nocardia seriolae]MTJ66380.1 transcriptional regulator [Nocardia seriolae]MTJ72018.1 transcriptional regulator [Nocardia seriolae]MTJ85716.1 transcriptional regulator [Nocardia seriolae]MTK29713.1 transcriptional regulator [Nocardia seriolae]MTK44370.1 transcriptional regulator [Nocardia seriolae]